MSANFRKTKIVVTVGPSCRDVKILEKLVIAGADVFRINASHTDPKGLAEWIKRIRAVSKRLQQPMPILVDLQGPRVRTGRLVGGEPLNLKAGDSVVVEPSNKPGREGLITTPVRQFSKMLSKGDSILIDNGAVELKVMKMTSGRIFCHVVRGGLVGENKGINLPFAPATLPALTRKDKSDLRVACRLKVDFVALSFVRSYLDVEAAKSWIKRAGKSIPVIAKIEKPVAFNDIERILTKADIIMIARGDLGIEMGLEKVPAAQKILIGATNEARIPVITATQMLESMIEKSNPTRAEISDIANAVLDGTDAVMLSGETAAGKYPVEAVRVMDKTIREAETTNVVEIARSKGNGLFKEAYAIASAASHAAQDFDASAIIVFTESGKTAELLSKIKPESRIIAITTQVETYRRMALLRGVTPLVWPAAAASFRSAEELIREAERRVLKEGLLKPLDHVVIVSGKRFLRQVQFMTCVRRLSQK